ncbi:MAG: hypothetical protein P9M06_02240 [Candidatus Saelkia tenebricola]|nr:hypothetical protein [Candidatus Saelkia tenebricola]
MKFLILSILILVSFSLLLHADAIPEILQKLGFTQYTLVKYEMEGSVEHFTFDDWTTKVSGDIVTFMVINGKITEVIRGVGENQGEEI